MNFTEWLRIARNGDPERKMPYASLYEVADELEAHIGENFDLNSMLLWLRETFEPERELPLAEALVTAEANWRLDCLVIADPEAMETAGEVIEDPRPELVIAPDPKGSKLPSIPPLPCGFRGVDGNECPRPSVLGAARCVAHGGMILDPEVRRSLLISAHAKMLRNIEFATETLLDVMETDRNGIARVQAAKELLDRAGMTAEQHIVLSDVNNVLDTDARTKESVALLRDKLNATRDRLRLVSIPVESKELGSGS